MTAPKKPKPNAKSIRMSDLTLTIIENFHGDGFNQKLENLAFSYACEEKEIKANIARLEDKERRIQERIKALVTMERTLANLKTYIDGAKRIIDTAPIKGQQSL